MWLVADQIIALRTDESYTYPSLTCTAPLTNLGTRTMPPWPTVWPERLPFQLRIEGPMDVEDRKACWPFGLSPLWWMGALG